MTPDSSFAPKMATSRDVMLVRWPAWISSGILFLLWGAFFVEHLSWFFSPQEAAPPTWVWFLQVAHLCILIGYLVAFKWERIGSAILLISTVTFFAFTAGENFLLFEAISLIPVFFYAYGWIRMKHNQKHRPLDT